MATVQQDVLHPNMVKLLPKAAFDNHPKIPAAPSTKAVTGASLESGRNFGATFARTLILFFGDNTTVAEYEPNRFYEPRPRRRLSWAVWRCVLVFGY
ncbi:unnamed protein product [Symbiodinium natans]|uniref:Uncharacterized protein n=1 Tax=Symbiodinium natans TaxID=878477 RepID=A0A812MD50_9DINO|nr:unnamed protein product [Symbiodinium natans]